MSPQTPQPQPDRDAQKRELRERAAHCAEGLAAAEDAVARQRNTRDALMRAMFEAGISWAEIGRTFNVSPQAAMYASGVRTRTGRAPKNATK